MIVMLRYYLQVFPSLNKKNICKTYSYVKQNILPQKRCYIILLKFKYVITKEFSNSPAKLLLAIFFLLYKDVMERNMQYTNK